MSTPYIKPHNNKSFQPINIEKCEEHYNAKFIGDFCIKTKNGGWSEMPLAIFYNPNPNRKLGHTHYFGLFVIHDDTIAITCGDSAFSEPINALIADDGEIIFSRYRHDFVQSQDGSVWIDGGRDYTRYGANRELVQLVIDKDQLVIK